MKTRNLHDPYARRSLLEGWGNAPRAPARVISRGKPCSQSPAAVCLEPRGIAPAVVEIAQWRSPSLE